MELYNDISTAPIAALAFWAIIVLLATWSLLEAVSILRHYRDRPSRTGAVWLDAQQWLINVLRLCALVLVISCLRYFDRAAWVWVIELVAFYTLVLWLARQWEIRIASLRKAMPEQGSR